jgi:hypothetical protein
MAPASATEAGASPALGRRQRLGQEGQGQREYLIGRLGERVVTNTLQDNQLTETVGQIGDDLLPLGTRSAQSGSAITRTG